MWLPCRRSQSRRDSEVTSTPPNDTVPRSTAHPDGSTPRVARQVSVLPLPDSPTSPTISPGRTRSDTPRTAVAAPSCTLTCTSSRRSTSSAACGPAPAREGARSGRGLRLSIAIGTLQARVDVDERREGQRSRAAAVADGVGQRVQRADGDGDQRSGDERRPRRLRKVVEVRGQDAAPGGCGRLDADAEEGDRKST